MPSRCASFSCTGEQQSQCLSLKLRLTNRVLCNEPRSFSAVFTSDVFSRPAMLFDQLSQSRGIPLMDFFHASDVRSAQLSGIEKFLAHPPVFIAHAHQFLA